MRRTFTVMAMAVALLVSSMGVAFGEVNYDTPSTNEINKTKDWAHFNVVERRVGEVEVEFVNPRTHWACFEYRSDGEDPIGPNNPNPAITDGVWLYVCVNNSAQTRMLSADVEIRMVFGGERDERFDWTSVDIQPAPEPEPGAHGLEIANSGPAGERANDNARFKEGNPNARFNR